VKEQMTLSRHFLLLFCSVVLGACLITGGFAVHSLHQAYLLFTHATKPELIPVMAGKMYTKAVVGFCVTSLFSIGIALPVGIYLLRQASRPYLFIFEHLTDIAHKRLQLNDESRLSEGVVASISRFLELWRFDYEKLRDYEKEKEWKNGARMLLHELKNPLTPLKLSLQKLQLKKDGPVQDDLKAAVKAAADIENILTCFKELVNIEFGPKETIDAVAYINELYKGAAAAGGAFGQTGLEDDGAFPVVAEKTLLKILYGNLVRNGLEANPAGFSITITMTDQAMHLNFVTSDRTIENTSRIFRLGCSTKGKGRGYGLFICKKISDYLDLDLKCSNRDDGVVFSLRLGRAGTDPTTQKQKFCTTSTEDTVK
jgi:signal transduction histidine kinase